MTAKTHIKTRAGADSTATACHFRVNGATGSAAVQERDAATWFSVRRRETKTAATIAQIMAQNRSWRLSHASVDIAADRSACRYIDTAAIQATDTASVANPLRLRRRPRFTHTSYAVSKTGAFASHLLVIRSMCWRYATRSLHTLGKKGTLAHSHTKGRFSHQSPFTNQVRFVILQQNTDGSFAEHILRSWKTGVGRMRPDRSQRPTRS